MTTERMRILDMLAQGKITASEADRLLTAIGTGDCPREPDQSANSPKSGSMPKYLRVLVEDNSETEPKRVNIRIPIGILKLGVKLGGLIPIEAKEKVDAKLREKGLNFDISSLKSEDLDQFIRDLSDLTVDVDGGQKEKVRIFCE